MPAPTRDTSTRYLYRGDTWTEEWFWLGNLTGYQRIWFTAREGRDLADSYSAIQILLSSPPGVGDGLQYIAGLSATVAANGAISIVDVGTGNLTTTLEAVESAKLGGSSHDRLSYDIQWMDAAGDIHTAIRGMLNVIWDVTRAVT